MVPNKKELVKEIEAKSSEIEGELSVPFLTEKLEEGKSYVKHLVNEMKKLVKASAATKPSDEMDAKEAEVVLKHQHEVELKTSLRKL